jgi:hypothetical protein
VAALTTTVVLAPGIATLATAGASLYGAYNFFSTFTSGEPDCREKAFKHAIDVTPLLMAKWPGMLARFIPVISRVGVTEARVYNLVRGAGVLQTGQAAEEKFGAVTTASNIALEAAERFDAYLKSDRVEKHNGKIDGSEVALNFAKGFWDAGYGLYKVAAAHPYATVGAVTGLVTAGVVAPVALATVAAPVTAGMFLYGSYQGVRKVLSGDADQIETASSHVAEIVPFAAQGLSGFGKWGSWISRIRGRGGAANTGTATGGSAQTSTAQGSLPDIDSLADGAGLHL